jgi:hypothetical protein
MAVPDYHVKGERMDLIKIVKPIVLTGVLALMAVPSLCEAAGCAACSGIGVSNGYYANPAYGGYAPGYGYVSQAQIQPVKPKPSKSKKKATKQKPAAK